MSFPSSYPYSDYPASPLGYGAATTTTTVYPPMTTTTVLPSAMPMASTIAPVGIAAPAATPMMGTGYGAQPGFWARHHLKRATKEHGKAMKELNQGDQEDFYKHQSRAARHEYKFNRNVYRHSPNPNGYLPTTPALPYPGVSTFDAGYGGTAVGAGYSATLYPPFNAGFMNDFSYGGGYAYDYPNFVAPTSPYGAYGNGGTWF